MKKAIKDMYLADVSTRRGEEILELLAGYHSSAKTLPLLTKELDEEGFRRKEVIVLVLDFESEETSINSERWSIRSLPSIGGGSV